MAEFPSAYLYNGLKNNILYARSAMKKERQMRLNPVVDFMAGMTDSFSFIFITY